MMEKQRTRAWRRYQAKRVFKARLKYVAACRNNPSVNWTDLLTDKWSKVYKTTGTPCSCWLCRGEVFDRNAAKKEANKVVQDAYMEITVE